MSFKLKREECGDCNCLLCVVILILSVISFCTHAYLLVRMLNWLESLFLFFGVGTLCNVYGAVCQSILGLLCCSVCIISDVSVTAVL